MRLHGSRARLSEAAAGRGTVRQLHVVSLSEDGRFVLLAPSKNASTGAFRVALDARLASAVRGDLPRPGESAPRDSVLSPREIQARLRAGESVEEIARSAGVPAAKVDRFAGPVVSERARIVDAARAAVLARSRRGASAVPLGEAVDAHLAEVAGLDAGSVAWSARRRDDGVWAVEVSFSARGRKKKGCWLYDPAARELHAVDASSSVLGFVEPPDGSRPTKVVAAATASSPRRRRAAARSAPATQRRSAAAAKAPAAARKAPATARTRPVATKKAAAAAQVKTTAKTVAPKTVAPKTVAAKSVAAKTVAAKSAPSKAAGPKTTGPKTAGPKTTGPKTTKAAGPATRTAPAAARTSPPAGARTPPAARPRRAVRRTEAEQQPDQPQSPPQLRVVPDPDAPPTRRASVPAWADVLLSTTPPARPTDAD
jgi:hypothetical protein